MKKLLFASFILFLFSCRKDTNAVVSYDTNIHNAKDFAIDPATGDTVYMIFMPNGFTPNGDGKNEFYQVFGYGIKANSFTMSIYDRNQYLMFKTTDLNDGWDGAPTGFGNLAPIGVYNVEVALTDTLNTEHHYDYSAALWR